MVLECSTTAGGGGVAVSIVVLKCGCDDAASSGGEGWRYKSSVVSGAAFNNGLVAGEATGATSHSMEGATGTTRGEIDSPAVSSSHWSAVGGMEGDGGAVDCGTGGGAVELLLSSSSEWYSGHSLVSCCEGTRVSGMGEANFSAISVISTGRRGEGEIPTLAMSFDALSDDIGRVERFFVGLPGLTALVVVGGGFAKAYMTMPKEVGTTIARKKRNERELEDSPDCFSPPIVVCE